MLLVITMVMIVCVAMLTTNMQITVYVQLIVLIPCNRTLQLAIQSAIIRNVNGKMVTVDFAIQVAPKEC